MLGFLQGFRESNVLLEPRDDQAIRPVMQKAVELAMLGFPEHFNAIYGVLAMNGQLKHSEGKVEYQCIWQYSGLQPPNLDETSEDAVWVIAEEELRARAFAARNNLAHLPDWLRWDERESFDRTTIERLEKFIEESCDSASDATSGFSSMKVSAGYAALVIIAYDLNLRDVVAHYMPTIFQRIHANQQARYLTFIPDVWKDYLLPGCLRDALNVSREASESYAQNIVQVAEKRFKIGPLRSEQVYPDCSVGELLTLIEKNTIRDPGFTNERYNLDVYEGKLQAQTIMRQPAIEEQITQTEIRLGRKLPDDLKEFYRYTNGCARIRVGEGGFNSRLPPLEDLTLENDYSMDAVPLELLPAIPNDLFHKIDWPGMVNGAIAMHEHDGQGSLYLYILDAEDIKSAKEDLQTAYDEGSDNEKDTIDRSIQYWFGSREAFDAVQDHCYLRLTWCEGAEGIYPTLKGFIAVLVTESEHYVEKSPVKLPNDLN